MILQLEDAMADKSKAKKSLYKMRIQLWPANSERMIAQHKKILQMIGEVVAEWASVENRLAVLLAKGAKCSDETGRIILFSLNSFAARLATVRAVVLHCMKDHPDQHLILLVLTKLRDLSAARNDLVHSSYVIQAGKRPAMYRKIVRSERAIPVQQIRTQTGEIETHLQMLNQVEQFLFFATNLPRNERAIKQWADALLGNSSQR
jgi:hypothetical protein